MTRFRFPGRVLALAMLALSISGCETRVGLEAAGGGFPTGTGSVQTALVGEWSLILLNQNASGALVSASELRWRFDQNGTVTRTSIATDFASGFEDVVRATGTWSATPSTVTINLTSPPSAPLPLSWRIEGSASGPVLVLGTLRFLRR